MTEKFKPQLASAEDQLRRGFGSPQYFGRFITALEVGVPQFAERLEMDPEDLELIKAGKAAIPDRSVIESWKKKLNLPEDDGDNMLTSAGYPLQVSGEENLSLADQPFTEQVSALRQLIGRRPSKVSSALRAIRGLLK